MYPNNDENMNKYDFCENLYYLSAVVKRYLKLFELDETKFEKFTKTELLDFTAKIAKDKSFSFEPLDRSIMNQMFAEIKPKFIDNIGYTITPSDEVYDYIEFVHTLENNIAKKTCEKMLYRYSVKYTREFADTADELIKEAKKYENAVSKFAEMNELLTNEDKLEKFYNLYTKKLNLDKTAIVTKIEESLKKSNITLSTFRNDFTNRLAEYVIDFNSEIIRQKEAENLLQAKN